jgi:XTP/dITP diphosphohydrolase
MRVLLATGNAHKVEEVQEILGSGYTVEAHDTGVDETGTTFEENALLKARALAGSTGELAVGDDSGIEIDHLDGAPGIHSARWTGGTGWIERVLHELDGVPPAGRGCRYVCAAAAVWPDGREVVVRGEVEGVVVAAARGDGGFGYDPIVAPVEGDGRTFGEMTAAEKHTISHRARAFRALLPRLTA